jgi:hypothetical protein
MKRNTLLTIALVVLPPLIEGLFGFINKPESASAAPAVLNASTLNRSSVVGGDQTQSLHVTGDGNVIVAGNMYGDVYVMPAPAKPVAKPAPVHQRRSRSRKRAHVQTARPPKPSACTCVCCVRGQAE